MCTYFTKTKNRADSALLVRALATVGLLLLSTLGAQAALFNLTRTAAFEGQTTFDINNGAGTSPVIPFSQYQGIDNLYRDGAVVNSALILPSDARSGSGVYRKLFGLDPDKDGVNAGYNRVVTGFDSKISNGFDPIITVGSLIPNNGFFQFSLDINDGGNIPGRFLSLDDIQIYVGGATDPIPLPGTVATLGNLGVKVWDLQGDNSSGTKNRILSAGTGSGKADISVLIPASLFSGLPSTANVYLYSRVGELSVSGNDAGFVYDGFDNKGFDEWSTPMTGGSPDQIAPPYSPVPEPSTAFPVLCLMAAGLVRRSRGRVA